MGFVERAGVTDGWDVQAQARYQSPCECPCYAHPHVHAHAEQGFGPDDTPFVLPTAESTYTRTSMTPLSLADVGGPGEPSFWDFWYSLPPLEFHLAQGDESHPVEDYTALGNGYYPGPAQGGGYTAQGNVYYPAQPGNVYYTAQENAFYTARGDYPAHYYPGPGANHENAEWDDGSSGVFSDVELESEGADEEDVCDEDLETGSVRIRMSCYLSGVYCSRTSFCLVYRQFRRVQR
ncbi:hypothetical protein B0H12DRAFT_1154114 [Mycena haematopus]|nr:hypothetical protein B0H12DRAFT_1154114 [Mycena haematopus]